jgi:hypothetical protein
MKQRRKGKADVVQEVKQLQDEDQDAKPGKLAVDQNTITGGEDPYRQRVVL